MREVVRDRERIGPREIRVKLLQQKRRIPVRTIELNLPRQRIPFPLLRQKIIHDIIHDFEIHGRSIRLLRVLHKPIIQPRLIPLRFLLFPRFKLLELFPQRMKIATAIKGVEKRVFVLFKTAERNRLKAKRRDAFVEKSVVPRGRCLERGNRLGLVDAGAEFGP